MQVPETYPACKDIHRFAISIKTVCHLCVTGKYEVDHWRLCMQTAFFTFLCMFLTEAATTVAPVVSLIETDT